MSATDEYTIADIARHVQAEHTRMVEQFMLTVDMFEGAQEQGHRIKFANFREVAGRKMRESAAMHASALADLMDTIGAFQLEEADREYIKQLDHYAAEIQMKAEGGES